MLSNSVFGFLGNCLDRNEILKSDNVTILIHGFKDLIFRTIYRDTIPKKGCLKLQFIQYVHINGVSWKAPYKFISLKVSDNQNPQFQEIRKLPIPVKTRFNEQTRERIHLFSIPQVNDMLISQRPYKKEGKKRES